MKVIGIDLGTTYSVMAYIHDGRPRIIPNTEGKDLTPSVVGFDEHGNVFVGESAKTRAILDAQRTITCIKRKMGSDEQIAINDKELSPQEVSAFILRKLKRDAEKHLGEGINKAVITVPAYFNDRQRQATKEAGTIAGLEVLRIINEPTAATLAYGLERTEGELVMVWDLGGGTFDVSILEYSGGVYEVRATSGDTHLGGEDWTNLIIDYLKGCYRSKWNVDVSDDPLIHERLHIAAEAAKCELSFSTDAHISCPFIKSGNGSIMPLSAILTKAEFESMTENLIERLMLPARLALKDSEVSNSKLNKAILVGGASRMPMVRKAVTDLIGIPPYVDIDPDKVVAVGAAIQAGVLCGDVSEVVLVDVIPLSLGVETKGGIFSSLIARNSTVPVTKDRIFTTAEDLQQEVEINILQGERELASHNIPLGKLTLADIPQAPKGIPKINVTFSVDSNGMVEVSAEDVYTGNEQKITVQSNRLNKDQIDRMIQEASQYHDADEAECERVKKRIEADNLLNAAARALDEMQGVVPEDKLSYARRLVNEGWRIFDEGDKMDQVEKYVETIKEVMDELHRQWKKGERELRT